MKISDFKKFCLKVVRGEENWTSLRQFVEISNFNDEWVISSHGVNSICPDIPDFALGILNLQENYGALKAWASFLLAASSIVDFSLFENSEDGEKLIEILWDLSFGKSIDKKIIQFSKKHVSRNGGSQK